IRVHLQFLGYPIANDPLYVHPAYGPAGGAGGLYHEAAFLAADEAVPEEHIRRARRVWAAPVPADDPALRLLDPSGQLAAAYAQEPATEAEAEAGSWAELLATEDAQLAEALEDSSPAATAARQTARQQAVARFFAVQSFSRGGPAYSLTSAPGFSLEEPAGESAAPASSPVRLEDLPPFWVSPSSVVAERVQYPAEAMNIWLHAYRYACRDSHFKVGRGRPAPEPAAPAPSADSGSDPTGDVPRPGVLASAADGPGADPATEGVGPARAADDTGGAAPPAPGADAEMSWSFYALPAPAWADRDFARDQYFLTVLNKENPFMCLAQEALAAMPPVVEGALLPGSEAIVRGSDE
ncbi:hypothetical protein H696_06359, partial [Fonticula alba]